MRILFIANTHLNLYKDIESELIRCGHEVVVIKDKLLRFDPFFSKARFRVIKKIIITISNPFSKYWKKIINADIRLSIPFDVLFVLSGTSVSEYIINYLESKNRNIKKVLYTWDSCSYYDFSRHMPYFDKCYTFDIKDASRNKHWKLLPIYYTMNKIDKNIEYDVFSVGSNHGGRLEFMHKIIPQLESKGVTHYIKVVGQNSVPSFIQQLKLRLSRLLFATFGYKLIDEKYSEQCDIYNVMTSDGLSSEEYNMYMSKARCVIDDQRDNQSGLTARFIWSLANGKKIITTNSYAYMYSFVNAKQVVVVDHNNPIIPIEFIKAELSDVDIPDISQLKLSNWVKELMS